MKNANTNLKKLKSVGSLKWLRLELWGSETPSEVEPSPEFIVTHTGYGYELVGNEVGFVDVGGKANISLSNMQEPLSEWFQKTAEAFVGNGKNPYRLAVRQFNPNADEWSQWDQTVIEYDLYSFINNAEHYRISKMRLAIGDPDWKYWTQIEHHVIANLILLSNVNGYDIRTDLDLGKLLEMSGKKLKLPIE